MWDFFVLFVFALFTHLSCAWKEILEIKQANVAAYTCVG